MSLYASRSRGLVDPMLGSIAHDSQTQLLFAKVRAAAGDTRSGRKHSIYSGSRPEWVDCSVVLYGLAVSSFYCYEGTQQRGWKGHQKGALAKQTSG